MLDSIMLFVTSFSREALRRGFASPVGSWNPTDICFLSFGVLAKAKDVDSVNPTELANGASPIECNADASAVALPSG